MEFYRLLNAEDRETDVLFFLNRWIPCGLRMRKKESFLIFYDPVPPAAMGVIRMLLCIHMRVMVAHREGSEVVERLDGVLASVQAMTSTLDLAMLEGSSPGDRYRPVHQELDQQIEAHRRIRDRIREASASPGLSGTTFELKLSRDMFNRVPGDAKQLLGKDVSWN